MKIRETTLPSVGRRLCWRKIAVTILMWAWCIHFVDSVCFEVFTGCVSIWISYNSEVEDIA